MTFRGQILSATAALFVFGTASAQASAASENRQYSSLVAGIVAGYDNENLEGMTGGERREWNQCVTRIFGGVAQGRKRYVLAGGSRGEQRNRLEQISLENQASVRQQITRDCPI